MLALVFIGLLYLMYSFNRWIRNKHIQNCSNYINTSIGNSIMHSDVKVINIRAKNNHTNVLIFWERIKLMTGPLYQIKILLFIIVVGLCVYLVNNAFFLFEPILLVLLISEVVALRLAFSFLKQRREKTFNNEFPDAIGMLTGSISSGDSIVYSFQYIGNTLQGIVGQEFKSMSERFTIGETSTEVLSKACDNLPYDSFYFFVAALNASIDRGSELKDVIQRINRTMFEARTISKKTLALTSEARASVKIVGAIPFIFLLILKFLSPENFDYVMIDPSGRIILYYVVASEAIGMFIIWVLMKRAIK